MKPFSNHWLFAHTSAIHCAVFQSGIAMKLSFCPSRNLNYLLVPRDLSLFAPTTFADILLHTENPTSQVLREIDQCYLFICKRTNFFQTLCFGIGGLGDSKISVTELLFAILTLVIFEGQCRSPCFGYLLHCINF
jgi:hypothetical protein